MATLQENIDWAKRFNETVDKSIGDDRLPVVFEDQKKLLDELTLLVAYVGNFCNERTNPTMVDIAKAQRYLFLRMFKDVKPLQACVLVDYLVFCLEAKDRMIECDEFKTLCLSGLPSCNLIPHQFTQSILKFSALLALDIEDEDSSSEIPVDITEEDRKKYDEEYRKYLERYSSDPDYNFDD